MRQIIYSFFFWVAVFVVSSLIVSAVLNPSILSDIKDKFSEQHPTGKNLGLKEEPSYEEITLDNYSASLGLNHCSLIESAAAQDGVSASEQKQRLCTYLCSQKGKDYYSYECRVDILYCKCLN